jgi:hypothetical protein
VSQRFTYRNPKILAHARGQACTNCGCEDGTTVAAHSNLSEHGKGRGIKAHDIFCAFLCHNCHTWLDQGIGRDLTGVWQGDKADKREMFMRAMTATHIILLRDGVLK